MALTERRERLDAGEPGRRWPVKAPVTAMSERMLTDVNLTHPDELNSGYPACTTGM
jgi:hypothetical protein